MARGWAISGVSDQTREAVMAAADAAGTSVGEWVERALRKAPEEGLEPGLSVADIATRLRQVVAEELRLVHQVLGRLAAAVDA